MEKYIELLKNAKENGETIEITSFLKKCKEETRIEPPGIMKEIIKNGLADVLVLE